VPGPQLLHDHPDFPGLIRIVASKRGVAESLVEKDYWVTHVLWGLKDSGIHVSFKGGTSLSKGFDLLQRFSEDLDVKLEAEGLPAVSSWRSQGVTATAERKAFFLALQSRLTVQGAELAEMPEHRDSHSRTAVFKVMYPRRSGGALPGGMRPFVQLEVGSARVTPGEGRPITSWIHEHVHDAHPERASEFLDNRPGDIHCVSPRVTLLEKIEAIGRRFSREEDAASFVRHYEDIIHILDSPVGRDGRDYGALLSEMRRTKDIRKWPGPDHAAWSPDKAPARWREVVEAWERIGPIFWGDRVSLAACGARIQDFLGAIESDRTEG
jgi:hypothetical protein